MSDKAMQKLRLVKQGRSSDYFLVKPHRACDACQAQNKTVLIRKGVPDALCRECWMKHRSPVAYIPPSPIQMAASVVSRAKKKQVICDLDSEWFDERIRRGTCEVTGIGFVFKKGHPFSPNVDRTVAGGNYTKDNCKLVVSIHNMARWTWGNDPLKVYINAMKDRI